MRIEPDKSEYRKILIISLGLILYKRGFAWLIFGGAHFRRGLLLEGIALDNKNSTKKKNNSNSPWAYIREGLLSEGCLRLRFEAGGGGLIFGRAFFWGGGEKGGLIIGILRYINYHKNTKV